MTFAITKFIDNEIFKKNIKDEKK